MSYQIERPTRSRRPPVRPYVVGEEQPQQDFYDQQPPEQTPNPAGYEVEAPMSPEGKTLEMPQAQPGDPTDEAEGRYLEAINRVPQKMPRLKSALKMLAEGLNRSVQRNGVARDWQGLAGQVGEGIGGAVVGAIDPTRPGQIQKDYDIERRGGELKTIAAAESIKSQSAARKASTEYRTKRLAQFETAGEEKKRFNDWRISSGNKRADTYTDWIEWRKQHGDDQLKTRQDYQEWLAEAESARDDDRDREYDRRVNQDTARNEITRAQLKLSQQREARLAKGGGAAGVDASEEEVEFWSSQAEIYQGNAETADQLDNEEDGATYRALARASRMKAGEAAAKGIHTRAKSGVTAGSGTFKYTEAQVRESAKRRGVDAEAEVQKARTHKLIP